ncbi:hypothetical protein ACFL45_10740 [Candidatus Neomarinimicrobiota bacterium]
MRFRSTVFSLLLAAFPLSIMGQIIGVKTLPLITTRQFNLAPSYYAGMGGVSIALEDALADGYRNPALITRLDGSLLYLAPFRDSWRDNQATPDPWFGGQPETIGPLEGSLVQGLPVGVIHHLSLADGRMRLTAGITVSSEQLRHTSQRQQFWDPETGDWNEPLRMNAFNWPMSGIAAIQFPERRLSIGIGVDDVTIRAVDGIPLLYPGAQKLIQEGHLAHYRLGASLTGADDSRWDILLLHKRYHMEQDAVYSWQDDIHNKDEEQSWLAHLKILLPAEDQARVGLELTAQRKWHPKIPDYPAPEVSIPRDPGITKAGRLGIGFSNRVGKLLAALDVTVEVIDSKTWGDTTGAVTADDGEIIKAGDPLFRNDYFFTNASAALGVEYLLNDKLRLQAGWSAKQYSIDYDHEDYVTGETITASPQNWWKEPTLSAGLVAKIGQTEWIFHTSRTRGTGVPFPENTWWPWWRGGIMEDVAMGAGDILAPPTGMQFQNQPVVMHRLTVVYWF